MFKRADTKEYLKGYKTSGLARERIWNLAYAIATDYQLMLLFVLENKGGGKDLVYFMKMNYSYF